MSKQKQRQYISFAMCLLMMVFAVISRDHRLLGKEFSGEDTPTVDTKRSTSTGFVINTTSIAKNVMGYGGITPVEITIENGKVTGIKALGNSESPDFFEAVIESGLLHKWDGMTLDEAIGQEVDAVSGATLSSSAVIANVQQGLQYTKDESIANGIDWSKLTTPKTLAALVVALMGALLPLWLHDKRYRPIQLLLNVCVLGLWSGTFVSYSLMMNSLANGVSITTSLIPLLILAVAFVYPLFGKKNHYCTWLCPFGSFQELIGRRMKYKVKMSPPVSKRLTLIRELLWVLLMLLMWTGLFFDWTDYEPFAAFMFREASIVTLIIAVSFLLLSSVVTRPYCRFACPTGTLMKLAEESK